MGRYCLVCRYAKNLWVYVGVCASGGRGEGGFWSKSNVSCVWEFHAGSSETRISFTQSQKVGERGVFWDAECTVNVNFPPFGTNPALQLSGFGSLQEISLFDPFPEEI